MPLSRPYATRTRFVLFAVALLTLCFAATSCGSQGSKEGKTLDLKIADVVPLTGANASFGPSFHKAAELAVEQAQAAAKAAGISLNVTLVEGDEGNTPQSAVSAARQITAQGASCVLGGTGYSEAIAQAVSIRGKIVQISPAATTAMYGAMHAQGGLTFRTITPDAVESRVLAAYMAKKLQGAEGKLVSVAGRNDSYGGPAAKAFAAAWRKLGGMISGPTLYDPNAASFDSEAAAVVAHTPVAFVVFDYPDTYANLGAALVRTGKFDAGKLFTTAGFPSTIPATIPLAALEGATVVGAGQPLASDLTKSYSSLYANSRHAPKAQQPYNQNNFDAAMLCVLGAVAADSTNGVDVAKKISDVTKPGAERFNYLSLAAAFKAVRADKPINYVGVSGVLEINSAGDPTGGLSDVSQYRGRDLRLIEHISYKGGRIVPVVQ